MTPYVTTAANLAFCRPISRITLRKPIAQRPRIEIRPQTAATKVATDEYSTGKNAQEEIEEIQNTEHAINPFASCRLECYGFGSTCGAPRAGSFNH